MDLSIIIVSWNVKELLKKCLESIYKFQGNLSLEVIVVDNASTDRTSNMVQTTFPQAKLIHNEKNLGFAKANNQGIKQAKGKFILILNPDTEILSQTLQKSIEFFNKHSDAGAVGCQILNPDKTIQPSVRRFPTLSSQLLILHKIHHIFPNLKSLKHYFAKDFNYSKENSVNQIMGAFILTSKKVIEKVGHFDENFYLWFEEVDFCKRLIEKGYQVYYTRSAQIIHHGAQSFDQLLSVKKQKIFNRSMRYYFKKYHSKKAWFFLASTHFDSLFLAWITQRFKKKGRSV